MILIPAIVIQLDSRSKIIPIHRSVFSPDISVLSQQLIRSIYPNVTGSFLKEIFQQDKEKISPIQLFSLSYSEKYTSYLTSIDPLIEVLSESSFVQSRKYKLPSNDFGKIIFDELSLIMNEGIKKFMKEKSEIIDVVKSRAIKKNTDVHKDSDVVTTTNEIIAIEVSFKLFMNNKIYVSLFPDDIESFLSDIILSKSIYFRTYDLQKLKIGYKIKIVSYNLETKETHSIISYQTEPLNFLMKNSTIRSLQIPYNLFEVNLFDLGYSAVESKIVKFNLNQYKSIKFKKQ